MEGGEVEAMASPFWSSLKTSRPAWYKEGKIRFLFQYGGEDHPELKSVPRALDLLQTEADKTLLAIAAAPLGLGRPFGAPPGIPADRLAALRTAMMATFKDPAFIADCAKQRLECDIPTSGEELGTLIGRAYARARRRAQAPDRDVSGDKVDARRNQRNVAVILRSASESERLEAIAGPGCTVGPSSFEEVTSRHVRNLRMRCR